MSIKILHVVLSLETGGLENGIVNITNRVDPARFDMDVLCLRARGELADRITRSDSKVIFAPDAGHGILAGAKNVYRACKQGNYHIVHAHGLATMLASWLGGRRAHAPIIINGEHGVLYDESLRRRVLQRWLFNSMDLNLSVSAVLIDDIVRRIGPRADNFRAIINGVDTETFKPDDNARQQIRHQFGFTDENFIVGSVGRLVEVKNYPSLVKGFTKLYKNHPQARLVFVGDGDQRQVLEQLARENNVSDQVYFPGRR
ncbi:MAG: glycosyltransferase, partial [Pseudomonadota bacterium]